MSNNRKVQGIARIKRAENGEFYCVYQAHGNRQVLATSETMKRRRSVVKNITAMAKLFGGSPPEVVDETAEE